MSSHAPSSGKIEEAFARRQDDGQHPFSPDMPVVLETLELVYPVR